MPQLLLPMSTPNISEPASPHYTSQQRAQLEIEELRLRIESLERPPYRQPTFWFSVIAAAATVFGLIIEIQLMPIRSAQAKLDVDKANFTLTKTSEQLQMVESQRKTLADDNKVLLSRLNELAVAQKQLEPLVARLRSEQFGLQAEASYIQGVINSLRAHESWLRSQRNRTSPYSGIGTSKNTAVPAGPSVPSKNADREQSSPDAVTD